MSDQKYSLKEFLSYLKQKKRWWLLPIILIPLILCILIFLSSTSNPAFIYNFF